MLSNKVIIAAAGSRKTTYLIEEAIKNSNKRILILTYTLENLDQIRKYIFFKCGYIPANIKIQSWFSFLLAECVRPYQNHLYNENRIDSVYFSNKDDEKWLKTHRIKRSNTKTYYLKGNKNIYTHAMSEFAYYCNDITGGKVIKRLENIYDYIFIDEVQDLAGYDLELIKNIMNSKITLICVGDIRQVVYLTNSSSSKNKQFRYEKIFDFFKMLKRINLCSFEEKNDCFRCNQEICNFADKLYPELSHTVSINNVVTGHDGIFILNENYLHEYIKKYNPKILRYNKLSQTSNYEAMNFGYSKGLTFERILIFPTNPIKNYLLTGNPKDVKSKAKLYVAITRARQSVAFIYNGTCNIEKVKKWPILDN